MRSDHLIESDICPSISPCLIICYLYFRQLSSSTISVALALQQRVHLLVIEPAQHSIYGLIQAIRREEKIVAAAAPCRAPSYRWNECDYDK